MTRSHSSELMDYRRQMAREYGKTLKHSVWRDMYIEYIEYGDKSVEITQIIYPKGKIEYEL